MCSRKLLGLAKVYDCAPVDDSARVDDSAHVDFPSTRAGKKPSVAPNAHSLVEFFVFCVCVCLFVCLFEIDSKTTVPIKLKFTYTIRVGAGSVRAIVLLLFFFLFSCLFFHSLFVKTYAKFRFFSQVISELLNLLSWNLYTTSIFFIILEHIFLITWAPFWWY